MMICMMCMIRHIFFRRISFWAYIQNYHLLQKITIDSPIASKEKNNLYKISHHLTKFKLCNSPVVVQFGLQFFVIAVHFNSFGVKMNSIDEISFLEGLITLIPINISCGCKEKIKNNLCQSLWL